jgi:hypothetical protein
MTITLDGTGGLFTAVRELIDCVTAANLHQGTTVPAEGEALLAALTELETVDGSALVTRFVNALAGYRSYSVLQSAIAAFARDFVINRVVADAPQVPRDINLCLDELIRQMLAGSPQTVEKNTVSASVSTSPGTAAPTLAVSVIDNMGDYLEGVIDEQIVGTWLSNNSLQLRSGESERNTSSYLWPTGSGIYTVMAIETAGLLPNYSFDADDDQPNVPDDWLIAVGTPGTHVTLTDTEIQAIAISGTPTSGYWQITFTRTDGYVQTTTPLDYNCSAADVQAALSELVGLSDVSVTASGTVPNQTFIVEFNAVAPAGDQSLLTTSNTFDTGSISVSESAAGEPAYTYRALTFLGDGSNLTAVQIRAHELNLAPMTTYAFSLRARKVTGTTGTLVIELVDGAGTVLTDDNGASNSVSINLSTLTTSFAAQTGFFRTPDYMPDVYYLRLRLSTAINSGKAIYLDDFIFVRPTALYTGGPYAALFASDRELDPDDRYVITVANDWAGEIQSWFFRWFGRLLPSAAVGVRTIPD